MEQALDILAIGAHPDDVEMTSGGLLALAASKGQRVGALHLTKGEMGTRGTPEQRVAEAEAASRALGLATLHFAGLKDGHVWCDERSVAIVAGYVRMLRPRLVIAPWTTCHHPDHEQAAAIVVRAVHFAGKQKYQGEPGGRVASVGGDAPPPHNVGGLLHARYSVHFEPSFYVDVSAAVERKLAAIRCYGSQFQGKLGEPQTRLSNPGFVDQLMARGAAFGLAVGVAHAEVYRSAGPLVVNDPVALFSAQGALPTLMR
jgi:bacillithiol biosynthesis deacetylase BshB1